MGPSFHKIEWFIEHEWVGASITCSAPEGADCRMSCPEGCEAWPCSHELADAGYCVAKEWFENADEGLEGLFNGDGRQPLRNGPVTFEWTGDWYVWDYVPEPVCPCGNPFDSQLEHHYDGTPCEEWMVL